MTALTGDGPISVERDANGVPHIGASTEADLYRGLGWCHATDRPIQLLLTRLAGRGRMAEHLRGGGELLEIDRAFRRLDFAGDAAAVAAALPAGDLALTEAYCDGIGRALARGLPWELRLAGLRRAEPWTPADCIVLARLAGWISLAESQGHMERLLIDLVRAGAGRERIMELFPAIEPDADLDLIARLRPGAPLVPDAVRWNPALPRVMASNNWVVGPARSRSGRALLANDPHLEVNRLPAVWQEVAARLGDRFFLGATMPGLPAFLIGRTNDLAWGATYAFMDAIDSWVEDCRDGCARRVVGAGEHWEPVRRRVETIHRRGAEPVTETFWETDRGVLDGDPREPGLRLATRWSAAHGSGAGSLAGGFEVFRARGAREGMAALGRIESAFNWVLADSSGSIGYQMSGRMPIRRKGVSGLVPLPGWDPENDWRGFAEPEDLPRCIDPPDGYIVTANHDLNHLGRLSPITLPMGDSRAGRIAERLAGRDDWTAAELGALQLDVSSRQAEAFMEILRPLLPPGRRADVLRAWDCCYETRSLGATLFERWYRELMIEVFGGTLGGEVAAFVLGETGIVADFYANFDAVLLSERSQWFGDSAREQLYTRAAERALATEPRPWGEQQQVTLSHLLFGGRFPKALGFDRGPVPLRGSRGTISQGQVYRSRGRETSFAPSYRLVTDLAEDAVHTAIAGGPSDRRFSRFYASGLRDWLAGRLKTLRP